MWMRRRGSETHQERGEDVQARRVTELGAVDESDDERDCRGGVDGGRLDGRLDDFPDLELRSPSVKLVELAGEVIDPPHDENCVVGCCKLDISAAFGSSSNVLTSADHVYQEGEPVERDGHVESDRSKERRGVPDHYQ